MQIPVTALKDFHYEGRAIRAGEIVSMSVLDAPTFKRHGLISLTRKSPPSPPQPQPSRRRYRRRDLEAER